MQRNMLNLKAIQKLVKEQKIMWTRHCLDRMEERGISNEDIKNAIICGKIIEYYYNDYPFPSCLILGCSINNVFLHIVCGISNNFVYMVTAYYPNELLWENNASMRRKK